MDDTNRSIISTVLSQFKTVWHSPALTFDEKVGFFCAHIGNRIHTPLACDKQPTGDLIDLQSRAQLVRAYMIEDQTERARQAAARSAEAQARIDAARQAERDERAAHDRRMSEQDRATALRLNQDKLTAAVAELQTINPTSARALELTVETMALANRIKTLTR